MAILKRQFTHRPAISHSCATFNYMGFPAMVLKGEYGNHSALLNYFIQLHFPYIKLKESWAASFRSVPEINWRLLSRHGVFTVEDIRPKVIAAGFEPEAFVNALAHGYVAMFVDNYYLPFSAAFQKRHFYHDVLLTGYDSERRVVQLTGGFNAKGRYVISEVSFADFHSAVTSPVGWEHYTPDHCYHELERYHPLAREPIYLIIPTGIRSAVNDLGLIAAQLAAYVNSRWDSSIINDDWTPIFRTNEENGAYGLDSFRPLSDYFRAQLVRCEFDFRASRLLVEHRQIMIERLKALQAAGLPISHHHIACFSDGMLWAKRLHQSMLHHGIFRNQGLEVEALLDQAPAIREREGSELSSVLDLIFR